MFVNCNKAIIINFVKIMCSLNCINFIFKNPCLTKKTHFSNYVILTKNVFIYRLVLHK